MRLREIMKLYACFLARMKKRFGRAEGLNSLINRPFKLGVTISKGKGRERDLRLESKLEKTEIFRA